MAYVAIGMAVIGMVSQANANKEQAGAQRRQIKLNRLSAKAAYNSTEDSVNIMKAVNREQTANAVSEQLRQGAADNTKVVQKVEEVNSKVIASNEGLTSGASKGRALITLQVKGQQALSETKSATSNKINQLVDQQDKITNDLNNKLLTAWQDMASVLSNTGPAMTGQTQSVISAGIGGASTGASMNGQFGKGGTAWQ